MQYAEGYLAFIDILGFSQFVENEDNALSTEKLFHFVDRFRYLYNTSPELNAKVSIFSDTIIITSNELRNLIFPITIAELFVKDTLGLLFRGGIVRGKYCHKNNTTFGPAVVSGYKLEKQAIYSRILIDKNICTEDDLNFFVDIDGQKCLNPYGLILFDPLVIFEEKSAQKASERKAKKIIIESLSDLREELLHQIDDHRGTDVVEKYLWRVRAYNYTCHCVANTPFEDESLTEANKIQDEEFKDKVLKLMILDDVYHFKKRIG